MFGIDDALLGSIGAPIIGSVLGGLFGGGSQPTAPGVSPVSQLPGQAQMGRDLQSATQGYMPTAQQFYGMDPTYANQAFQAMYGNPYAASMQTAAGQAGQMAGRFAPMAEQAGMGALGAGQQALGAGQQIWQTAQDPQQALYNRMQNQIQNQAAVTNSMYGLGASPAGAGAANQALSNFNIDWQNQQLARQLQGQNALNAGIGAYTGAAQQGLGLGQYGVGLQQQAGALPYQTAQGIAQNQFGAIGANQAAMGGALQPYQQNITNMQNYLGIGQGTQSQANQQAYQQQQLQRQDAANMARLGTQIAGAAFGMPQTYQPVPSGGMASTGTVPSGDYWANPAGSPYSSFNLPPVM